MRVAVALLFAVLTQCGEEDPKPSKAELYYCNSEANLCERRAYRFCSEDLDFRQVIADYERVSQCLATEFGTCLVQLRNCREQCAKSPCTRTP